MLPGSQFILIVASSGRMLAQAANKAGLKPLVIDLFADQDTQSYAEDWRLIPSLAIEHLAPAVDYFVKRYPVEDVIYGSGLEYFPESLFYLHTKLNILGNAPDTFARQLNKQDFFSVLDQQGILYPEISFIAPDQEDNWLIKPMQGQGGVGIKFYREQGADYSSVYWQKHQPGSSHSVLFLADGESLQVIGFNSQWTATVNDAERFVFSGVMNHTDLTNEQKQQITAWLNRLVPLFKLKGLNSLDFIQAGDKSYVLEVNPRPSASMQLYEGDWLTAHMDASQGFLCDRLPIQTDYTGYQIVYAGQDMLIPAMFEWPDGCMDLPVSGARISIGQPICSMIAHQKQAQAVLKQLSNMQQIIINKLERFQTHAIYR
jgi:methenyltetrahydromethanopterin cyclohydrolase